jgi:hypothetical protein
MDGWRRKKGVPPFFVSYFLQDTFRVFHVKHLLLTKAVLRGEKRRVWWQKG